MESWTNRPHAGDYSTQIPIVRSQPGKILVAHVTADDCIGAYTHFFKGRTCLCTHPNCEPCDLSRTPRWYGYLAVVAPTTLAVAIFELTPSCVPAIDAYRAIHGTLRGATIRIQRATKKINARVVCTLEEGKLAGAALPKPPNVKAHLCKMWELPAVQTIHPEMGANGHAELTPGHNGKNRL